MISSSIYKDTVTIRVNHPTDRDAVERTAIAALRHGSKVSIVAETQGKRGLICSLRPFAGTYFVNTERGSFDYPTLNAAMTTAMARFAKTFDDLDIWSQPRRETD